MQSPISNGSDSGIHDSDSTDDTLTATKSSPELGDNGLPSEMVDGEVFAVQIASPSVVKKERHLSSSSKRASLREGEEQYYCGLGKCRPKWMQVFRDARFFTFLLCLNCFIEGALVSGE